MKDSIDTGVTIVTRTNTLITILSALIIGVSGYVIATWEKVHHFQSVFVSAILGLVYLFIIAIYTVKNIAPEPYYPIGSTPKDLMIDSFFVDAIVPEERITRYYVSEIKHYQFRIDQNSELNKKRWVIYKKSLWALMLTPAVFSVVYCTILAFRAVF